MEALERSTPRDHGHRRQLLLIFGAPLLATAVMATYTLAESRPGGRTSAEAAKFRAEGIVLWAVTTLTAFVGPAVGGLLIRDGVAARAAYAVMLGICGGFVKIVAGFVIWAKYGGGFD